MDRERRLASEILHRIKLKVKKKLKEKQLTC